MAIEKIEAAYPVCDECKEKGKVYPLSNIENQLLADNWVWLSDGRLICGLCLHKKCNTVVVMRDGQLR